MTGNDWEGTISFVDPNDMVLLVGIAVLVGIFVGGVTRYLLRAWTEAAMIGGIAAVMLTAIFLYPLSQNETKIEAALDSASAELEYDSFDPLEDVDVPTENGSSVVLTGRKLGKPLIACVLTARDVTKEINPLAIIGGGNIDGTYTVTCSSGLDEPRS